jgi:hypothetical protein
MNDNAPRRERCWAQRRRGFHLCDMGIFITQRQEIRAGYITDEASKPAPRPNRLICAETRHQTSHTETSAEPALCCHKSGLSGHIT